MASVGGGCENVEFLIPPHLTPDHLWITNSTLHYLKCRVFLAQQIHVYCIAMWMGKHSFNALLELAILDIFELTETEVNSYKCVWLNYSETRVNFVLGLLRWAHCNWSTTIQVHSEDVTLTNQIYDLKSGSGIQRIWLPFQSTLNKLSSAKWGPVGT